MNIKELAEEVGISFGGHPMNPLSVYFSELKRFAELVRQDEREQCAKVCEGLTGRSYEFDMGRLHSAAAIRARSK